MLKDIDIDYITCVFVMQLLSVWSYITTSAFFTEVVLFFLNNMGP